MSYEIKNAEQVMELLKADGVKENKLGVRGVSALAIQSGLRLLAVI
jgi:hypothetical protein